MQNGTVQTDTYVDSIKGDAVGDQGFMRGSMQNDTTQGDIYVDSVKGNDAIYEGSIEDSTVG
eukprot:4714367-Alexandrium_andersonii.AAC.1